jgi:hypothetical protein
MVMPFSLLSGRMIRLSFNPEDSRSARTIHPDNWQDDKCNNNREYDAKPRSWVETMPPEASVGSAKMEGFFSGIEAW